MIYKIKIYSKLFLRISFIIFTNIIFDLRLKKKEDLSYIQVNNLSTNPKLLKDTLSFFLYPPGNVSRLSS